MRILSDFDGVLTHQDAEAEAVARRLDERVTEALGGDAARALAVLTGLRAEVRAKPEIHGWYVGEEIGCYADEDPYVFNNAVCRALFVQGPAEVREKVREKGCDTADALAFACFEEGTKAYRAAHASQVLEEALGALSQFFASGAEVVIVSNSSTERIQALLEPTKIARWGTGKLRIRGGAKKFHVTGDRPKDVPKADEFGGRQVLLRRGSYWDIINEERPDAVIGDVLSLDAALPAALRKHAEEEFGDMQVFLRSHPHTPAWAAKACEAWGITRVDSIARLPKLLGA